MQKEFRFSLKSVDDRGSFVGFAAVYSNVDLGGDVIEPGAFAKTLAEKNGEVPILWQHDAREPIGLGKLTDSPQGLLISGELALESPVAQKAYGLLKRGILKGLSIGYDTVKQHLAGGVRKLTELKLYEVSLVTFPMNEQALVTGVKTIDEEQIRNFRQILADCRKSFRL